MKLIALALVMLFSHSTLAQAAQPLTAAQKAEAAQFVADEYRLQRAWGAAFYKIEQPMQDIAGLVSLFNLCMFHRHHFGDNLNGGETYSVTGTDCPIKYSRRTEWKGNVVNGKVKWYAVDDDTAYSTTDSRVLAELNIESLTVNWDIRHKEPSPIRRTFEMDRSGFGKAIATEYSLHEDATPEIRKATEVVELILPTFKVDARAMTWMLKEDRTKQFSKYMVNNEKVTEKDFEKITPY